MDSTTVRMVCAGLMLVFGALILFRRKRKVE